MENFQDKIIYFDIEVNELYAKIDITQTYRNISNTSLEIKIKLPKTKNQLLKFTAKINEEKLFQSKVLDIEKAKEKYTDAISSGNTGLIAYQSAAITLPAGVYTLKVAAYNAHTATAFTSKLGFIPTEGSPYISSKTSFASKAWVTDEVTFTLNEDTEGKFQIGGAAGDSGSGNHAKVFFDNLTLTYKSFFAAAIEDLQTEIAAAEALKTEARTEGVRELNAAIEAAKALLTSTVVADISAGVPQGKSARCRGYLLCL